MSESEAINECHPCLSSYFKVCRAHTCRHYGDLGQRVGSWWGNALDKHRRAGLRTAEEIDIVGLSRNRVTVIGECKWTNRAMDIKDLVDLETFKVPALAANH